MERSISNSVNTSITISESSEESSWTTYFEYFLASEEKKRGDAAATSASQNDDAAGNSVVSDAASCAGKLPLIGDLAALSGAYCKNVKLKKRRVRGLLDEDPLEDTASSPVNSPKVSDLFQLELSPPNQVIPSRTDTRMVPKEAEILQEKGEECTELKKRGLCVVPLSMLLNYVG